MICPHCGQPTPGTVTGDGVTSSTCPACSSAFELEPEKQPEPAAPEKRPAKKPRRSPIDPSMRSS